jgi:two-component system C4-dicarboxylate transport sensor histidine kinase DctB
MKSWPIWKNSCLRGLGVVIILTIVGGGFLTVFLGRVAENGFEEKVDREANLTASLLHDNLEDATSAAKSLAPAEAIVAALTTGSSIDLERANRLLDRIKDNFEMSVCYLIDSKGLTIASSNRNEKDSFVGQSFASRPYFSGAAAGRLTRYFAYGKITHERGYYASIPAIDSAGAIAGVIVVKKNVAPVEELIDKDSHVYLVSPEGIISSPVGRNICSGVYGRLMKGDAASCWHRGNSGRSPLNRC